MPDLRILLGDDHEVVRHGLRRILSERPTWAIVGEVGDGREAVRQAVAVAPDVVVLDIGMPVLNGIEATRQIVRRVPRARVLILSMHADEAYVERALEAGALGYLLKEAAATDLIRGVEAAGQGRPYFSPAIARLMESDPQRSGAPATSIDRYGALTEREREVFQLVAEGRSSPQIADLLCVSLTTVETHRAHIFRKLDLHSTAALVLYAVRRGIIA